MNHIQPVAPAHQPYCIDWYPSAHEPNSIAGWITLSFYDHCITDSCCELLRVNGCDAHINRKYDHLYIPPVLDAIWWLSLIPSVPVDWYCEPCGNRLEAFERDPYKQTIRRGVEEKGCGLRSCGACGKVLPAEEVFCDLAKLKALTCREHEDCRYDWIMGRDCLLGGLPSGRVGTILDLRAASAARFSRVGWRAKGLLDRLRSSYSSRMVYPVQLGAVVWAGAPAFLDANGMVTTTQATGHPFGRVLESHGNDVVVEVFRI